MAAASDKARYFLEQSVPELKELERKEIFTAAEISSIARQRSNFEHKINARGSTPLDFARYAEFEINVDTLKKKRVARLGIKSTNHSGQRRIFFVFDRATKKHPGDVGLWMQSIEYARKQKAHKKLSQIFTDVLRLHPTKAELWIYAAQFAMEEHGDMTEARGYMQRGLRFCKGKRKMWVQYARLEMMYIAKIQARRHILGIDQEPEEPVPAATETDVEAAKDAVRDLAQDQDQDQEQEQDDQTALQQLGSIPAQSGAIPMAIFDAAISHFKQDVTVAEQFQQMLQDFNNVAVARNVLEHIIESLRDADIGIFVRSTCEIQLPVFGVAVTDPGYPSAFRESLRRLKHARATLVPSKNFEGWVRDWLQKILEEEDLDPALQTVAKAVRGSIEDPENC
jgi:U3 small nucleolar RNA-associated protein 6